VAAVVVAYQILLLCVLFQCLAQRLLMAPAALVAAVAVVHLHCRFQVAYLFLAAYPPQVAYPFQTLQRCAPSPC
jgi:hypothetical protein